MDFYAIALIIDDSVKVGDLAKAKNASAVLSSFLEVKTIEGGADYYVFKDVVPETQCRVYIAVTRKVPNQIKNKIQSTEDADGIILPAPVVFWLDDGIDYPRAEVERRMKLWIREDGGTHIWFVDLNTPLTGDIISKFVTI